MISTVINLMIALSLVILALVFIVLPVLVIIHLIIHRIREMRGHGQGNQRTD